MAAIRQLITGPLAFCAFVLTFYATGKLMFFLSEPRKIKIDYVWLVNLLDHRSSWESALYPIYVDALLIVGFILQHSLMRTDFIKSFWTAIGLETAERSIYNLATAGTLLFLLRQWLSIPSVTLWNIDTESSSTLWWAFVVTHGLAWTIIYGGSVIMDLPELLGIKQVYYDINKLLSPMVYKSRDLVRLYGHVRHPSFFGLTIILWATNLMSLDRLLLAILLTTYMFVAWNTDKSDVAYQRIQLQRKKRELSY